MGRSSRNVSERGVSLIELVIYLAVLAIIGIPIVMVTLSVSRASAEGDMLTKIQERNRSSLQRIIAEYQGSLKGTASISDEGRILQFTSNGGFDGAAVIAGPTIRYEIRPSLEDSIDGADNNNNGRIDEGILLRRDQSTGEEVVLTDALKTSGSSFTWTGTGITVTLATSGHARGTGAETTILRSLVIYPRN